MELNKAIQTRHSVRKFSNKKPDWRDIIECINAARFAPMAGGNFTVKFIVVGNKEKIQKIADAAQQNFIAEANFVVVVCSDPLRPLNAYGKQGEVYSRQQAGAAIENFLLKIQERKLATTWVGYFVESIIKETLKIPDHVNVEAIFPIGYEFKKTASKIKIDLDSILYFEEYRNKRMRKPQIIGKR